MKRALMVPVVGMALLVLAGCGTQNSTTNGQTSTTPTNHTNTTTTASSKTTSTTLKKQHIYLTVLPGGKLGSDGKKHDAFSPSNFTLVKGVPTTITIYNYDDMKHSITSPKLNLNVQANPSKKDGKPGVTTMTFTPKQAGTFQWNCVDPCDTDNNGWAMSHSGYMMGKITVQ